MGNGDWIKNYVLGRTKKSVGIKIHSKKEHDIDFGLAAGVWTNDIGRALRMSEKLRAGTIWVNTYRAVSFTSPFGGYKRSGEGRESGKEAIKEFLQVKSVWIAQETTTANPFVMR